MTERIFSVGGYVTTPSDWKLVESNNGPVGFLLPDGRVIKPCVAWELQDDEKEEYRDLTSKEQEALGLHYDMDHRSIE